MYQFSFEQTKDYEEIEVLFDLCFAPGRKALSSYRLRQGVGCLKDISVVVRDKDAVLAAALRFWPVRIGFLDSLLLGPIAVHPTQQGEGLGGQMIEIGLRRAVDMGWHRVLLVGDESYFGRFGFSKLLDVAMPPPTNPARILGCALSPNAWDDVKGTVTRWVS
ncbi:MAG: N-acetyltransferase [Aestuariivita sp.]|nr:N-acetyltransferase [Aestuariivita sp.]